MAQLKTFGSVLLVVLAFFALSCLFTVPETHRGLMLRLGKLVTDSDGEPKIYEPGLHAKLPLITNILTFDKRLQTLELKDSRIVTKEKKDVIVSSFTKWRIEDFARFYKATSGQVYRADQLLAAKVSDALRAEFGKRTIKDVVSGERVDIMELLQEAIDKSAASLGVAVVDMRIKRIDLPTEVSDSVYQRMRAEREQAATQHRADGKREAEKIKAAADKKAIVLLAEADKKAKTLRGEGDAEAARIYAEAYSKNPDFYSFYRSLQAYQDSFRSKDDVLLVSPDNEFFRYFKEPSTGKKKG